MLRTRVIPALLLHGKSLVKTERFGKYRYIGDPANTVRIFNELEVDELIFLDITASKQRRGPNLQVLRDIAGECFMPLAYGGGIRSVEEARAVFDIGFEKVAINTHAVNSPQLITDLSARYGSQAIIVSIDVKTGLFGRQSVRTTSRGIKSGVDPVEWAAHAEKLGAGEILLTSIDREGTYDGFDLDLVRSVADAVSIPVIAHGGAGTLRDVGAVVVQANATAVALGSMVVFQKKGMGVLVNFPEQEALRKLLP